MKWRGNPSEAHRRRDRAGYQGPEQGPFLCGNCVFYHMHSDDWPPEGRPILGNCVHPKMHVIVDYYACCNYFKSAGDYDALERPDEARLVPHGIKKWERLGREHIGSTHRKI